MCAVRSAIRGDYDGCVWSIEEKKPLHGRTALGMAGRDVGSLTWQRTI